MVKVSVKSPAPMSWAGFFQIAEDTFQGKIDGKNTYRNVFGEKEKSENEAEQRKAEPAAGGQKPEKKEPEPGTNTIAPAQKETPPASVSNSENSDSAIAEEPAPETAEEPEQVEIDEILPAPVDSDPMRDLKDRFEAELSSLKVLLDCNNFSGMSQSIERLEHLRVRMAGLEALN